jgi:gluconokinase
MGALYRAVLEGVLFNLYQNYRILVQNTGFAPPRIGISGGITQSPFWMQLAADIFGVPLEENTGEHASLLGAAYIAAKAAGMLPALTQIPEARGKRHEPNADAHEREMDRFGQWIIEYNKDV